SRSPAGTTRDRDRRLAVLHGHYGPAGVGSTIGRRPAVARRSVVSPDKRIAIRAKTSILKLSTREKKNPRSDGPGASTRRPVPNVPRTATEVDHAPSPDPEGGLVPGGCRDPRLLDARPGAGEEGGDPAAAGPVDREPLPARGHDREDNGVGGDGEEPGED